MALSEQQLDESVDTLLSMIDKELSKRSFKWSLEIYDYIKRDFINTDIFEPLSEEYFDEYDSGDDRRDVVIALFEDAALDLAQELKGRDNFAHETADSSSVTFMYVDALEFYEENTQECDEAIAEHGIDKTDATNDDKICTANYYVMRDRIQKDVDALARFFEEIDGDDYL